MRVIAGDPRLHHRDDREATRESRSDLETIREIPIKEVLDFPAPTITIVGAPLFGRFRYIRANLPLVGRLRVPSARARRAPTGSVRARKMKSRCFCGPAIALSCMAMLAVAAQATTVFNGGFETGDLTGWTLTNSSVFDAVCQGRQSDRRGNLHRAQRQLRHEPRSRRRRYDAIAEPRDHARRHVQLGILPGQRQPVRCRRRDLPGPVGRYQRLLAIQPATILPVHAGQPGRHGGDGTRPPSHSWRSKTLRNGSWTTSPSKQFQKPRRF